MTNSIFKGHQARICGLFIWALCCLSSGSLAFSDPTQNQATTSNPVVIITKQNPPPLSSHVMTYHHRLGMVVLFGGSDPDRRLLNTLWGWDGTNWHVLSEEGPAPRIHTSMAYDKKGTDW